MGSSGLNSFTLSMDSLDGDLDLLCSNCRIDLRRLTLHDVYWGDGVKYEAFCRNCFFSRNKGSLSINSKSTSDSEVNCLVDGQTSQEPSSLVSPLTHPNLFVEHISEGHEDIIETPSEELIVKYLSSLDFGFCTTHVKDCAHLYLCDTVITAIEAGKAEPHWLSRQQSLSVPTGNGTNNTSVAKSQIRSATSLEDDSGRESNDEMYPVARARTHAFSQINKSSFKLTPRTQSLSPDSHRYASVPESLGDSASLRKASTGRSSSGEPPAQHKTHSDTNLTIQSVQGDKQPSPTNSHPSTTSFHSSTSSGAFDVAASRSASVRFSSANFTSQNSPEAIAAAVVQKFERAAQLSLKVSVQPSDIPPELQTSILVNLSDGSPRLRDAASHSNSISQSKSDDMMTHKIACRGTVDWAPPRYQIISKNQPQPRRKDMMQEQNFRCAACGAYTDELRMKKYRYCHYLGKWFCEVCHSNDALVIPGRVLDKWDFKPYSVSHFSRDILMDIYSQAVFNVAAINVDLYYKMRSLMKVREYRYQLGYLMDYLRCCRASGQVMEFVHKNVFPHLYEDPELYSTNDLCIVKSGKLVEFMEYVLALCKGHLLNCHMCQEKGHICEVCKKPKVIFPFDLRLVTRCPDCQACYHRKCLAPRSSHILEPKAPSDKPPPKAVPDCPRCLRLDSRRIKVEELNASSSDVST